MGQARTLATRDRVPRLRSSPSSGANTQRAASIWHAVTLLEGLHPGNVTGKTGS
ncbi:MAG: hypothetical protein L6428_12815 [Candidatus Aminicenantes bacterium]|nr:hypothetical protein [Candidatus Aminicenantes bacterium]